MAKGVAAVKRSFAVACGAVSVVNETTVRRSSREPSFTSRFRFSVGRRRMRHAGCGGSHAASVLPLLPPSSSGTRFRETVMNAACEAVVHAAVVGPVFMLAGLIEAAARLCQKAAEVADQFAGEPRRPSTGRGELRMA
jgi:hypothetical protein